MCSSKRCLTRSRDKKNLCLERIWMQIFKIQLKWFEIVQIFITTLTTKELASKCYYVTILVKHRFQVCLKLCSWRMYVSFSGGYRSPAAGSRERVTMQSRIMRRLAAHLQITPIVYLLTIKCHMTLQTFEILLERSPTPNKKCHWYIIFGLPLI